MPPADDHPPEPQAGAARDARWTWQFLVTIGLLVAFAVLIVLLMVNARDATEVEWNRRVYLFAAVEAIVFTSVGWLFGREVNRDAAINAKSTIDKATRVAETAQKEASEKAEEAAIERTKGETVRAFARNMRPAPARSGGAEEAGLPGQVVPRMDADPLRGVVEALWPD